MSDNSGPDQVLEALLRARYSCRGFRSEPVPGAVIRRMFELAQRTASWCNAQAWSGHLLSGEATRAFGAALTSHVLSHGESPDLTPPDSYEDAYRERRRAAGFGLYSAVGVARDDMDGRLRQGLENYRFFGAPHVVVVTSPRALGVYGAVDCGAYAATLMTAAESLGVNSIAQAAIAMYSRFVHEYLAIPDERLIVCAVSFGYADPAHPANAFRTDRAAIESVVAGLP